MVDTIEFSLARKLRVNQETDISILYQTDIIQHSGSCEKYG